MEVLEWTFISKQSKKISWKGLLCHYLYSRAKPKRAKKEEDIYNYSIPKTLVSRVFLISRNIPKPISLSLCNHGDPLSLSLSPQNPNPSFPSLPLFHHHHHNHRQQLSLCYLLPLSPPPPRRCRIFTPPCISGYFGSRVVDSCDVVLAQRPEPELVEPATEGDDLARWLRLRALARRHGQARGGPHQGRNHR